MTDSTSEVVAGVLAEHEDYLDDGSCLNYGGENCGWVAADSSGSRLGAAHRAHVADTIAAALGELEREVAEKAWDEGWNAALNASMLTVALGRKPFETPNPYARAVPHGE